MYPYLALTSLDLTLTSSLPHPYITIVSPLLHPYLTLTLPLPDPYVTLTLLLTHLVILSSSPRVCNILIDDKSLPMKSIVFVSFFFACGAASLIF